MATTRGWRKFMLKTLGFVGPLTVAAVLCAQSQTQPEMTASNSAPTFSSRVNLVMVPVVVRDKTGRAVGNLKQEDFQLFDRGKIQIVSRFSVESSRNPKVPATATREGAGESAQPAVDQAPLPERFVAYVFDDIHTSTADLARTRIVAQKHLDETLNPTTRAAIFTTSGQHALDFTDDKDKLREGIAKIQRLSLVSDAQRDCPAVDFFMADDVENKHDDAASGALLQETFSCAALDPTKPEDVEVARAMVKSATRRGLVEGEENSRLALRTLRDIVRRMTAAPGGRTIVLLSQGFFLTSDLRFEENDVMDRAIKGNVTISAVDARGLFTIIPGGDASTRSIALSGAGAALRSSLDRNAQLANADIMAELADATGGTFFHNNNGILEGLKLVAAQPEYMYVLGFSPQNLKLDGAYHALKVSIKAKGYDLQARRGYFAPRHLANPEEEAKQEISEAFFSREELVEIPMELKLQFFKSDQIKAKLTVVTKLDVRPLSFRKADDRNANKVTVVAGVFDRNGNYVAGVQQVVDLKLRDQTLAAAQNSGITLRSMLDLTPGSYFVRVVVRDFEGQKMAARNGVVEIPY
jgi:VWFA-related protein